MRILSLLLLLAVPTAQAAIRATPEYVGNDLDDSVIVSFCTFDTTYYPQIVDADSVIAIRYGPDNQLVDSLTQSDGRLANPRTGWYEIHYRGADGAGTLGCYRVHVRARIGGDWRGAASVSYQVIGNQLDDYLASLVADGDSIKDTLSVLLHQGDPMTADSAAIARSVWDDDVVSRSGRRIGWNDTANVVNDIPASGTGAYACSVVVLEDDGETPIQGVFLRVMNDEETATTAVGRSDANGRALFSLDADEYHLFPYLVGYQFSAIPETLMVGAQGSLDTITASRFDPGEPATADLCRVYGLIHSLGAQGLEGVSVTATILIAPLLYEGVVVSPYSVSATTDSTGYWYLDVIPNALLTPAGTQYDFTIYNESGTLLRKQIEVPDSESFEFGW